MNINDSLFCLKDHVVVLTGGSGLIGLELLKQLPNYGAQVVFEQEEILTVTNYADFEYSSGIIKDNIHAFQFHREKSGENGINIYRNFKLLVEQGAK
jgi:hypothetical protein